jgi:SAM-dependent methyltransferase
MGTIKREKSLKYIGYWNNSIYKNRFNSYQNQLIEIYNTKPKTVLEIGVGCKLVYNHLKEIGIKVTSLDINKNLKPDYIGDIRKLPFKNNSFDTVCAFEVLEHIPFNDFEKSLKELKRVSKKNIIISIPIRKIGIEFYM